MFLRQAKQPTSLFSVGHLILLCTSSFFWLNFCTMDLCTIEPISKTPVAGTRISHQHAPTEDVGVNKVTKNIYLYLCFAASRLCVSIFEMASSQKTRRSCPWTDNLSKMVDVRQSRHKDQRASQLSDNRMDWSIVVATHLPGDSSKLRGSSLASHAHVEQRNLFCRCLRTRMQQATPL